MSHRRTRFIILLALLAILIVTWRVRRSATPRAEQTGDAADGRVIAQFLALEAREREAEQTVWAKEMAAQNCGRVFESLWDSINAATNKLSALASFSAGEVVVAKFDPPETIAHDIQIYSASRNTQTWTPVEWRKFLRTSEASGWELADIEFRHIRFDVDAAGQPRESQFYFRAHLLNEAVPKRAMLEGNLLVQWMPRKSVSELPGVKRIDSTGLTLRTRAGAPPFIPVLNETIKPPEKSHFIDPLILYDLDGDGRSEIILVAKNLIYRQQSDGHFTPSTLCQHPIGLVFTGVLADFDGDGAADLATARFEGVFLVKGSPRGEFPEPGRMVWEANPHFRYAQAVTCGDVDLDGDLDLFIAQYKLPYTSGQMPTPYYDANDGDPAYLLLNDGNGNFTDATDAAGLGRKRWRRTYSASFADLDLDGCLDLIVISDFAGVDVYRNNGRGLFIDMTQEWISDPHGFGMGHAIADFDADGRLDLLMIGMNSPTADRLNHLKLWRTGVAEDHSMRARLAYGNRLLFAKSSDGFELTATSDSIARSGWSWGCTASDFNNDGWLDVYIANGHETRRGVSDYEPEFWLHDIFAATSTNNAAANVYFLSKANKRVGNQHSFGGHEQNRFFLNHRGAEFLEIGNLIGVGLKEDSRAVVADDLDGDGRLDLLLTTFEAWPESKQTLRVYRNHLSETGNWIGFRFREGGRGISPVGATVTLRHAGGVVTRQIVTGDSHRSQHANTLHFGLGNIAEVETAEFRWINGKKTTLKSPSINRYHEAIPLPE